MGAWLSRLLRQARSSSGFSTAGRSSNTSHSMAQREEQFWLVMRDRTQLHAVKHQKYVAGQLAGWLMPSLLMAEACQPSLTAAHNMQPFAFSDSVLLAPAGNERKLAVIVLHPHGWLGGSSSDHVVMELFRSSCVCFNELGFYQP